MEFFLAEGTGNGGFALSFFWPVFEVLQMVFETSFEQKSHATKRAFTRAIIFVVNDVYVKFQALVGTKYHRTILTLVRTFVYMLSPIMSGSIIRTATRP